MAKRIKIGDVFAVKIHDEYAIGQYISHHRLMGAMVRVFRRRPHDVDVVKVDDCCNGDVQFCAFVAIKALCRDGLVWPIGAYDVRIEDIPRYAISYFTVEGKRAFSHVIDLASPNLSRVIYYDPPMELRAGVLFVNMSFDTLVKRIRQGWDLESEYNRYIAARAKSG